MPKRKQQSENKITINVLIITSSSFLCSPFVIDEVVYRHEHDADINALEKTLYDAEKKSSEGQPPVGREHRLKKCLHTMAYKSS